MVLASEDCKGDVIGVAYLRHRQAFRLVAFC